MGNQRGFFSINSNDIQSMHRYSLGDHGNRLFGMRRFQLRVFCFLHHDLGGLGGEQVLLPDGLAIYTVAEVSWLCVGRAPGRILVSKDQAPCPDKDTNSSHNTYKSCNSSLREYCDQGKDD